jgi:hypothetical protein
MSAVEAAGRSGGDLVASVPWRDPEAHAAESVNLGCHLVAGLERNLSDGAGEDEVTGPQSLSEGAQLRADGPDGLRVVAGGAATA